MLDVRWKWPYIAELHICIGKRSRGTVCASGSPSAMKAQLPMIDVVVDGVKVLALVDSGCTQSIVARRLARKAVVMGSRSVMAVDGKSVSCGVTQVEMVVNGRELNFQCLVMDSLLVEVEVIIGMDVIRMLGGVSLGSRSGGVNFGAVVVAVEEESTVNKDADVGATVVAAEESIVNKDVDVGATVKSIVIEDVDFDAMFDGKHWTVRWKWIGSEPDLANQVSCYKIGKDIKDEFDEELETWIKEGILEPVPPGVFIKSVLPLMAVEQASKGKVRPVLDFRQLNYHVSSHSGGSVVCDETVRKWRKEGHNVSLLDLKRAYLQVHVDPVLWKYQAVQYKDKYYYLTRLGFGLNCAPKVMSLILQKVLAMDTAVDGGTNHYIDDILVNENKVPVDKVAEHLRSFGLETKPPERINDARVLGLQMRQTPTGHLCWSRGNDLPTLEEVVTRRQLFSVCGQLVGHYPVAGWLRIACGFIKRHSGGTKWEDSIGDVARDMLSELMDAVANEDPVGGRWVAPGDFVRVWCDASSLAIGCALEIDGEVLEDAAWLRKKNDGSHINMAELDAVINGLNLAVKWQATDVEIVTDSATVFSWLKSTLSDRHKIRTHGMSEMLVKRRLQVVKELCTKFGMTVSTRWVQTAKNKADVLTRVRKRWLEKIARSGIEEKVVEVVEKCCAAAKCDLVAKVHGVHHLGVDRTLFLAKLKDSTVTRADVQEVVSRCSRCKSVDPAPIVWDKGDLVSEWNWARLSADVTHYNGSNFLTVVDNGPSRFAIWRRIKKEDALSIVVEMEQIFRERGPPQELLMDNGTAFRSAAMRNLLNKWNVTAVFRCAYRPAGNGVVERNHRTIKRMAARSNADPLDMVYWLNNTPKEGVKVETVPARQIYTYDQLRPREAVVDRDNSTGMHVGDEVFVKPPLCKCTTFWPVGTVTGVQSPVKIEVDGIPRHIADVRVVPPNDQDETVMPEEQPPDEQAGAKPEPDLPVEPRIRKHPQRFGNNVYDT